MNSGNRHSVSVFEGVRQIAKRPIRLALRKLGYELHSTALDEDASRMKLIEVAEIELVLDVGANQGQYAEQLRAFGYRGRIMSFEPSSKAFRILERAARGDGRWKVHRLAVGDEPGRMLLNVSGNSVSSSLLQVGERHVEAAPGSAVAGREYVEVCRLDSLLASTPDKIMLKIDTQGYELPVLRGVEACLSNVRLIQVELSLVPLYEAQASYLEVLSFLDAHGFIPCLVIPGFADRETGELLQIDVVAKRKAV